MGLTQQTKLNNALLYARVHRETFLASSMSVWGKSNLSIVIVKQIYRRALAAIALSSPGCSKSSPVRFRSSRDAVGICFKFDCGTKPPISYLMPGTGPLAPSPFSIEGISSYPPPPPPHVPGKGIPLCRNLSFGG